MKYPWMQFYPSAWLTDPRLSMCAPATRGIWIDLVSAMHELDRSGEITGTKEQLARTGRCSLAELDAALTDLQNSGAADVVPHGNGSVTVINRRMKREANDRKRTALRVAKHRSNAPCNAEVTPDKLYIRVQSTEVPPSIPPAAVELPNGFPPTVDDAVARAGLVGIADVVFVTKAWNKAMARSGRDARDIPIRNFGHWITYEWSLEKERSREAKARGQALPAAPGANGSGTSELILRQKEFERVSEEMQRIIGTYSGHQAWAEDDRKRYGTLLARKKELKKLLGLTA